MSNKPLRKIHSDSTVRYQALGGGDLPVGFQFSQSSLQDFVDCRRRFQLRYIWNLAWPAIESEPVMDSERRMRQGALFHQMINQHLSGVSLESLTALIPEDDQLLANWWQNYKSQCSDPNNLSRLSGLDNVSILEHEVSLTIPIGGYRLVAKYDLILTNPNGRLVIVDWKTSTSSKPPKRQWLIERLQTRVYRYILTSAGGILSRHEEIDPNSISMVYWYANHPDKPLRFAYSNDLYQADQEYINNLIASILGLDSDDFPLTEDDRQCTYCVYRSLCNRGVEAGDLEDSESEYVEGDSFDLSFNFEQIAEIEF